MAAADKGGAEGDPQPNPFERVGRILVSSAFIADLDADLESIDVRELLFTADDDGTPQSLVGIGAADVTLEQLEQVRRQLAEGHTLHAALLGSVVQITPLPRPGTEGRPIDPGVS